LILLNKVKKLLLIHGHIIPLIMLFTCMSVAAYTAIIEDHDHYSKVMDQTKHYRVYLPPNYYDSDIHYPVIYWMHGHAGTYNMTKYHEQWTDYIDIHNVLLVIPDPRNPNGSTYDYSLVFDNRTYEGTPAHNGKIFSKYFRELVQEIDSNFRTIADRDHRGISGQSRGGFMSPYITSQNKDLVNASSMSCPSPDGVMVGPMNKEVLFQVHDTGRALKGVSLRISSPDGDRYKQYTWELKAIWGMMDMGHLEMHVAHYPNHYAADMDLQFDFHMKEFEMKHSKPSLWHHADPWPEFNVWDYSIAVTRDNPAITFVENVSLTGMIFYSRPFLPNGPIIQDERVMIITDSIYQPSIPYTLVDYNLSTREIGTTDVLSDKAGRLNIELKGGGHALGINKKGENAKLFLIDANNQENHYAEEGVASNLSLQLINVGNSPSGPVQINISTPKDFITLSSPFMEIQNINPGQSAACDVEFLVSKYGLNVPNGSSNNLDGDEFVSKISLELNYGNKQKEIESFIVFPIPRAGTVKTSDVVILDGRQLQLPFYQNQHHTVSSQSVNGGKGDGDGIAEGGETVELYIKVPQGLGPEDQNTYHRAFLLNQYDDQYIKVDTLSYHMRGEEWSGAPCYQSQISIDPSIPNGHTANLILRTESYDFVDEGYENLIQRHKFHFYRLLLTINNN